MEPTESQTKVLEKLFPSQNVLLPDWIKYLVLVNVARVFVVVLVRHFPRIVGDQDQTVEQVAHYVVDHDVQDLECEISNTQSS